MSSILRQLISFASQLQASDVATGLTGTKLPPLKIPKPKKASSWALRESEFGAGLVGGKSGNLATLRGKLPDSIAVPASVALPFGTFERVLEDDVNKEAAATVAELQNQLVKAAHTSHSFYDCLVSEQ